MNVRGCALHLAVPPTTRRPLNLPDSTADAPGSSLGQDVCPTVAGKVQALDKHVRDYGLVNSALSAT